MWNVATGELVRTIDSGGGAVYTIDFDSTGKTVFATTSDQAFKAYDVATGTATVIDASVGWGFHTWDVSRDGRTLAGPARGGIALWDQKTYRQLKVIPGNAGGTSYVAFSPDGRTIASTGGDGVVRLWDVQSGQLISTPGDGLGGGSRLRFTEDGRRLVVWGADQQVHIYGPSKDGKVPVKKPVEQTPPVADPDDDD